MLNSILKIKLKKEITKDIIDPTYGITLYEPLNMYLHSDSTRIEEGYAVNGWKEDHYSTGELLHKDITLKDN